MASARETDQISIMYLPYPQVKCTRSDCVFYTSFPGASVYGYGRFLVGPLAQYEKRSVIYMDAFLLQNCSAGSVFFLFSLQYATMIFERWGKKLKKGAVFMKSVRHNCPVEIYGLPLWSVAIGPDELKNEKIGTAKGVIAIGDSATGVIAIGYLTKGVVSIGLVSMGVVSFGLLNVSIIGFGLFSIALFFAKGIIAASIYRAHGLIAAAYEASGSLTVSLNSLF